MKMFSVWLGFSTALLLQKAHFVNIHFQESTAEIENGHGSNALPTHAEPYRHMSDISLYI
jgi:hypothetical protein